MGKKKLTLLEYFEDQKAGEVQTIKANMRKALDIGERSLASYIYCGGPVPKVKQAAISKYINENSPKGTTYIIDWQKMNLQYIQNMANMFNNKLKAAKKPVTRTTRSKSEIETAQA